MIQPTILIAHPTIPHEPCHLGPSNGATFNLKEPCMTLIINLNVPINRLITLQEIDVLVNGGKFELPNLTNDMLQLLQERRPQYKISFKLS